MTVIYNVPRFEAGERGEVLILIFTAFMWSVG